MASLKTTPEFKNIEQGLALVRSQLVMAELLRGACIFLPILMVIFLGLGLIEYFIWLKPLIKLALALLLLVIIVAAVYFWFIRPWLRSFAPFALALLVEKKYPQFAGRLVCSVELADRMVENKEGYSAGLFTGVLDSAGKLITAVPVSKVVDHRPLYRLAGKAGLVIAVLAIPMALLVHPLGSAWNRLCHMATLYSPLSAYQVKVVPGNAEVVAGDSIRITALFQGEKPQQAQLVVRREDRSVWDQDDLTRMNDSIFTYNYKEIRKAFSYYVKSGDFESEKYQITILNRPMVKKLAWTLVPPVYTKLPARVVTDNLKQIEVPVGTRIIMDLESNKRLSAAWLEGGDSTRMMGTVDQAQAKLQLVALRNREFSIRLKDEQGIENKEPITYQVSVIKDEFPQVKVLWPAQDVEAPEKMVLPLKISIWDDFGFTSLQLVYRINEESWNQANIAIPQLERGEAVFMYEWDLDQAKLLPDEVVTYYLKVFDNDAVSGPKSATSATYKVRLPSIYELFAETDREQNQQMVDLQEVLKRGTELKADLQNLQREMLQENKLDWQRKKEVQGMMKKQEELGKKIDEVASSLDKTMEKLSQNDMVTMETMKKMEEIRNLMNEVATPELKNLMQKVQDAMNNLDMNKMKEMMQQFTFSQQEYLEKLDRTLALLKQIKAEQKLDEAMKKCAELSARQDHVNQNLNDENKAHELAGKEDKISQDAASLQQDLKDPDHTVRDASPQTAEAMQKAAQYMEQNQLAGSMMKMSQSIQNGDPKSARSAGQKNSQNLQQLSQMLSQAKEQMQGLEKEALLKEMDKIIKDLLYLSGLEEDVFTGTQGLTERSQRFQETAEDQSLIYDGMAMVTGTIINLSKRLAMLPSQVGAELGSALSFMQAGVKGLEDRNVRWAALNQKGAFTAINSAVVDLLKTKDALNKMSSSGQSGLMQQLNALGQKQGGLNQLTQSLMQMLGQGGALSMEQQAAMARLAGEQEALHQQLQDLNGRLENMNGMLGRLDQVGQEMKEVAQALGQQKLDNNLVQKQQTIYNRLLEFQHALKKEDYSNERKAETGKNYNRLSPPPVSDDAGAPRDEFREDMLKALQEKYPQDYQKLIKAYFKRLSEERP